jgi:hypothetical protein
MKQAWIKLGAPSLSRLREALTRKRWYIAAEKERRLSRHFGALPT